MVAEYFKRNWIRLVGSLLILGLFTIHASKWYQFEFINRLNRLSAVEYPEDERSPEVVYDSKRRPFEGTSLFHRWINSMPKASSIIACLMPIT